tara:strand:- start:1423 stop:1986 length:564 start_codon:yes stop_codon:yes gene_type:complete
MSDYAPDPKKQLVYTNLQNKTLADVTADDIQKLTDPTFIQATNQDALITYNIVNRAAMRDGTPMPLSGKIALYTQTDDNDYQYFQPPKGEVWRVVGVSALNSANLTGGNSNSYYSYLTTDDQVSLANSLFYQSTGSGSTNVGFETLFEKANNPLIMDHNMFLLMYSNMAYSAVGATVTFKVAYVRLR